MFQFDLTNNLEGRFFSPLSLIGLKVYPIKIERASPFRGDESGNQNFAGWTKNRRQRRKESGRNSYFGSRRQVEESCESKYLTPQGVKILTFLFD